MGGSRSATRPIGTEGGPFGPSLTTASPVYSMSTRTGVHRGDELEAGRQDDRAGSPDDGHPPVFERLPEGLEHVAAEFGQLVEEEHALVRPGHLAGCQERPAADHAGVGTEGSTSGRGGGASWRRASAARLPHIRNPTAKGQCVVHLDLLLEAAEGSEPTLGIAKGIPALEGVGDVSRTARGEG